MANLRQEVVDKTDELDRLYLTFIIIYWLKLDIIDFYIKLLI